MMFFSKLPKSIILGSLLLALSACSSKPVVQEFPVTANVSEEIMNLERDLGHARSQQINALSPNNFDNAAEALSDAKEMYSKGKKPEKILHEVALGRAYLNNANTVSEVARNNIEQVVAAREAAITANAPTYFSSDWKKIDEDFKDLTEEIEKNKLSNVPKERTVLQKRYMDIELRAIKEKNLRPSRNALAQAKKEKALKFAPRSYAIAEKSIADTDAYITANRYNNFEIEARSAETKKLVDQAIKINHIAQSSKEMSSEELAMKYDEKQRRLDTTSSRLGMVEDRLSNTQSALDREKSTNSSLEHEKALNDKYEKARKQFSSSEAEVYKQGNALLIRLKGLNFPTAKAVIPENKKELLNKVDKIIADFGPSTVFVEGHTDSTGAKATNMKISEDRAFAVKSYLQENSSDITSIRSEGFGYQKPITSNKTADGRAKNRRVDIIIKPDVTSIQ